MRSTGEVMGLDTSFEGAHAKSQLAAGIELPRRGTAFLSVKDSDKVAVQALAAELLEIVSPSSPHPARLSDCAHPVCKSTPSTRCSKVVHTLWIR